MQEELAMLRKDHDALVQRVSRLESLHALEEEERRRDAAYWVTATDDERATTR